MTSLHHYWETQLTGSSIINVATRLLFGRRYYDTSCHDYLETNFTGSSILKMSSHLYSVEGTTTHHVMIMERQTSLARLSAMWQLDLYSVEGATNIMSRLLRDKLHWVCMGVSTHPSSHTTCSSTKQWMSSFQIISSDTVSAPEQIIIVKISDCPNLTDSLFHRPQELPTLERVSSQQMAIVFEISYQMKLRMTARWTKLSRVRQSHTRWLCILSLI